MIKYKGSITIATILVLTIVLFAGLGALLRWSMSGYRSSVNRATRTQMLYAAESGLQYALAGFNSLPAAEVHPKQEDYNYISNQFVIYAISNFPSNIKLESFTVISNRTFYGPIKEGGYKGYQAYVQEIKVHCGVCDKNNTNNLSSLEQIIQSIFISVFQFGVFYGHDDVEFHNGPPMNFTGPVHCNNNIYLFPNETLSFYTTSNAHVTAGGDFFHYSKGNPNYTRSGTVRFKDDDNIFRNMLKNGTWLDSRDPDWELESLNRWDGNVLSKDHDVKKLAIPIPGAESNTHSIVEMPSASDSNTVALTKYGNKAALVISGATVYAQSGLITNPVQTAIGNITNMPWIRLGREFINKRQGYMIHPLDINIRKFADWLTNGSGTAAAEFIDPDSEREGIMYVQRDNVDGEAVRLYNGAELPPSLPNNTGMTIATARPVYIKGNFNTVNNRPSSIICDAFTALSTAWKDSRNQTRNKNTAHNTTMRVAVMTGHTPTIEGLSGSSGGVHNLPRFLENWTGKEFRYTGSLVCCWDSIYEDKYISELMPFSYYYSPPTRLWGYDTKFSTPNGTPPGTPNIHAFEATRWSRVQ